MAVLQQLSNGQAANGWHISFLPLSAYFCFWNVLQVLTVTRCGAGWCVVLWQSKRSTTAPEATRILEESHEICRNHNAAYIWKHANGPEIAFCSIILSDSKWSLLITYIAFPAAYWPSLEVISLMRRLVSGVWLLSGCWVVQQGCV